MKLRLRSLQTKETTRLQVPDSCTLQDLHDALSLSHPSPSLFAFSLNGKDPLHVSPPHNTLRSIGVTTGDLIYFSGNHQTSFSDSSVGGSLGQKDSNLVGEDGTLADGSSANTVGFDGVSVEEALNVGSEHLQKPISDQVVSGCLGEKDAYLVVEGSSLNSVGSESSDVEYMDAGKKASGPYFLRRVLQGEVGGDRCAKKLLVVAVHAVFLESGFVGYDSLSGTRVDGFHVVDEWPSKAFTLSLFYSLPKLFGYEGVPEFVKLRFHSLGDFVNVYGSLGKGGSRTCHVSLNGSRFGPVMDLVWGNCDTDGADRARIEQEVFEFWKIVKDGLAYPLLIDLCEKCGLGLPPCLMLLPMDLKLKILESLSGVDVARLGCVCMEMCYLSSNNDLWKQKTIEEFGSIEVESGVVNWKKKFSSRWEVRKQRRILEDSLSSRCLHTRLRVPNHLPFPAPRFPVIWGDPDPVGVPHFIGGDYDRLPGMGVTSPGIQRPRRFPRFQLGSNFSPNCHLGGSDT